MIHANNFLEIAKELKNNDSEVYLRTATSRAYYACFLMARDYAESKGFIYAPKYDEKTKKMIGLHEQVINWIGENANKLLSRKLAILKSKRVKADYKISEEFPHKKQTIILLIDAENLLNQINSLS